MIPNEVYNILNQIWPIIFIFVFVVAVVRLFHLKSNGKQIVFHQEFMTLIFMIYLLLLFELVTNTDLKSISNNFIPFKEMFRYEFGSELFWRNVVGNIALFIPFGYFVCYYVKNCEFWKALAIGTITSLTIEAIQYKIGRTFDIDDIILNVIGILLGLYLYRVLTIIHKTLPKFTRNETFLNLLSIILLILITIAFFNYVGIWSIL